MRPLLRYATVSLFCAGGCALCGCSSQSAGTQGTKGTAGASGISIGCRATDGDRYEPGLVKIGSAGLFDFTLVSSTPAPPALDDNRFVVRVSDAEGNAVGGDLRVALDMPEHGHPSPKQPDIRFDAETGTFLLDPMRLFMVGLWRITFDFESAGSDPPLADSAVFEFCID